MAITTNTTISIGLLLALVAPLSGMWAWADSKFEETQVARKEIRDQAMQLKEQNSLLKQLVEQQAKLVEKAAKNAEENRETLIRIETKLEQQ